MRTEAPACQELPKLWHTGTPLDAGPTLKSRPMHEVKPDSLKSFSGLTKDKIQ